MWFREPQKAPKVYIPISQILPVGKDRQDCPNMTCLGCQATDQLALKPILTPVGGADPAGLLLGPGDSSSRSCSFLQSSGIQKLGSRPSPCSPKRQVPILNPKFQLPPDKAPFSHPIKRRNKAGQGRAYPGHSLPGPGTSLHVMSRDGSLKSLADPSHVNFLVKPVLLFFYLYHMEFT